MRNQRLSWDVKNGRIKFKILENLAFTLGFSVLFRPRRSLSRIFSAVHIWLGFALGLCPKKQFFVNIELIFFLSNFSRGLGLYLSCEIYCYRASLKHPKRLSIRTRGYMLNNICQPSETDLLFTQLLCKSSRAWMYLLGIFLKECLSGVTAKNVYKVAKQQLQVWHFWFCVRWFVHIWMYYHRIWCRHSCSLHCVRDVNTTLLDTVFTDHFQQQYSKPTEPIMHAFLCLSGS